MNNQLTQKVNFYVSIALILFFGSLMAVTIVHALNKDQSLWMQTANQLELED